MQIESYPSYGTEEEKELWLERFGRNYNQSLDAEPQSTGTALTSGVTVNDDNEIVDTDSPDSRLGFAQRYLHLRASSDNLGNTLVDPDTYSGTLFILGFNSDTESTPAGDANFIVLNEFTNWITSEFLYIIPFGFNNIRLERSTTQVSGRTRLETPTRTFDLEAGVGVGATGAAGSDAIQTVLSIRDTTGIDLTTDPAGWIVDGDGMFFRNNQGSSRTLVATVIIGGVEQDFAAHNTYTYSWTRNGATFAPSTSGQTLTTRYLQITAEDVEDNGADQFVCTVSNIPD